MLAALNANLETIALIALLIGGFVVAFKLLEMIFETVMVSVLSAGFYGAMAIMMDYSLTVNNLLLFAFLGSSLYMAFSVAASAYSVFSKLISIPVSIGKSIHGLFASMQTPEHQKKHSKLKKKVESYGKRIEDLSEQLENKYSHSGNQTSYRDRSKEKEESSDDNGKEVKEVVLNKVKEDKKDDQEDEDDEESTEEFRI